MEILTGEQMRRVDRRAIDELGIPAARLMEAAGRAVAEALIEDYPQVREVLVLCGKGNNGGDGYVAARHLARRGLDVRVISIAPVSELAGEAAANHRLAVDSGVPIVEAVDSAAIETVRELLDRYPLVLDAMLGTGVRGGARGQVARVVAALATSRTRVVAIDLPSGVDADALRLEGPAVRAERTYTLCRPKLPLVLGPAAALAGAWRTLPIGIPDEAVVAEHVALEWLDRGAARALLPARDPDTHKGTYGHLLAVAGSRGKSGAAVLLARAALRSGVGLITVATPASVQERVAVQQAEVMTEPLAETADGGLAASGAAAANALLRSRDALAIGPGLGGEPETGQAVRTILLASEVPAVVDADALNALAGEPPPFMPRRGRGASILTPHPGEAARLLGCSAREIQDDRPAAARRLAAAADAVVVLKGHRTLVARPDGRIAVNASGNPGLATAGTGDVLTGVAGALLARGLDAWTAARLAVFVHGDAGDRAARALGQEGLIASDVIAELPHAFAALAQREDGR